MKRKKFIQSALGLSTLAMLPGACREHHRPALESDKKDGRQYQWIMVTTWPPNYPIIGEGCHQLAKWIEAMSNGQLKIKVYGGGELIPPLECFEAVSIGGVAMASSASYYWAGKIPAAPFFAGIPFGFNAHWMNIWLEHGGGMQLWRDLYAPFDILPFNGGNTSMQMGGWFNRPIKHVNDFRGLKMRMPGIGASVLEKMGATPILSAGSEIYTSLERGVIDATEWIGPFHDRLMGFHEISKYYYHPGWHECGTTLEIMINRHQFQELPTHLQLIVESAIARMRNEISDELEFKNAEALQQIKREGKVEVLSFPAEVIELLRMKSEETIRELADQNESCRLIHQSMTAFKEKIATWSHISEASYYDQIF